MDSLKIYRNNLLITNSIEQNIRVDFKWHNKTIAPLRVVLSAIKEQIMPKNTVLSILEGASQFHDGKTL